MRDRLGQIRLLSTGLDDLAEGTHNLVTLGALALLDHAGRPAMPLSRHPRKLAVLTVLALARRPVARDLLVGQFWGERQERLARHSLSDALSEIRQLLGPDAVSARGDTVALAPDAPLVIDAVAFQAACGVGDRARAIALYGGPFLNGVFLKDAPDFELWSANERARLERLFLEACEHQVAALVAADRQAEAAAVATRWLDAQPLSAEAATALLAALRAPGTPAADRAALATYDRLAARLDREYESAPDPGVVAVAADIREKFAAMPVERTPFPLSVAPVAVQRVVRRVGLGWIAGGAAVLAAATAAYAMHAGDRAVPPATRPVVAVLGVRDLRGDTTSAWIADGLTQMIAADLARTPAVEIVAPERVRRAARMLAGEASGSGDADQPVVDPSTLAQSVGANWVVTGGLTRGDTTYVLDVGLYDVARHRSLSLYTITSGSLPVLADRAAARALAMANSNRPGPRFADVETASLEAYEHFVRAEEAKDEGRFGDERTELDRAIALDSGFVTALAERLRLAQISGEPVVLSRLSAAFSRASARATPWDRLDLDAYAALHSGERRRSEALAAQLVSLYPHDPRAYDFLARLLRLRGDWDGADSVMRRALALDSLDVSPVRGPCAPCTAYLGLANDAMQAGRLADAARAARSWISLRPDYPAAWSTLASALEADGKMQAALVAAQRARFLAPAEGAYQDMIVRLLLVSRRYADADTAIARMSHSTDASMRGDAFDLRALLEREHGQFRASAATIETAVHRYPEFTTLRLEEANSLARLGDYAAVVRLDDPLAHWRGLPPEVETSVTPVSGLAAGQARQFCWVRALEAESLAPTRDTVLLRALADSIAQEATRSYYGRDLRLADHVRGLIAEIDGQLPVAERDFQKARWGRAGWTSTLVRLARVQLEEGHPADAIASLRDAYTAPLDAMGRYVPRSMLDFWMARSFAAAQQADSAALYEQYVRSAWIHADPEVKRLLAVK